MDGLNKSPDPARIGRFEVLGCLGEGLQGRVYLALDPDLRRKVALKLVLRSSGLDHAGGFVPQEALHLAELRHHNIVSVHEFGAEAGVPYLVCEFIEGMTLREMRDARGHLPLTRSLPLAKGILEGMAHAHAKGILHLDLGSANVMVDAEGVARVMDFGLSCKDRLRLGPGGVFYGALAYMSPEHLLGKSLDARTDVYSLGLLAYELLTGRRAKAGADRNALIRATVLGQLDYSPLLELDPGGHLASWVRTAVAKDPGERYASAGAMLEAFMASPLVRATVSGGAAGEHVAVEYLLFRIRRTTDLPAISGTLAEISRLTAPDAQTPVAKLANAILCDHALTNKVLKLASSSFYGPSGRGVRNVSDAIRVLGMNAVRQACTALLGLRAFAGGLENDELVDALSASFVAGLISRHLASAARVRDCELAFICGLFHGVGRSLAMYHFPNEHAEAKALFGAGTYDWPQAQVEVFGVTYQELGRAVLRTWGFPEAILTCMAPWEQPAGERPETEAEALLAVTTFANRLCGVFQDPGPELWAERCARVIAAFSASLGITDEKAAILLEGSVRKFRELAPVFGLPLRAGGYAERVGAWCANVSHRQPDDQRAVAEDTGAGRALA
ncbi:MAG TPA: HDOD domain-containing protein [Burkholderiales bacterium]|jgi:serine/threonine protein kinase|nr:HDOD domain-containing protein [Burkholderiales bacterium]